MTQASTPWHQLLTEIQLVLIEDSQGLIQKPPRHALPLKDDGVLLVMPIAGPDIAAVKSISVCPLNLTKGLPAIQGEILVFDAVSGAVLATLDGALITAQRTAAVSALAAQLAAPNPAGDLLIIGAGVQGKNHMEAFHILFGTQRVWVQSKSMASAVALVEHAKNLDIDAHYLPPNAPYPTSIQNIATCTPAHEVVLAQLQNLDFNNLFITAIGSFKAHLAEISVDICQRFAIYGNIICDTPEVSHEGGDLLLAKLDPTDYPTLGELVSKKKSIDPQKPTLFKSCGSALWDLAAVRVATKSKLE